MGAEQITVADLAAITLKESGLLKPPGGQIPVNWVGITPTTLLVSCLVIRSAGSDCVLIC